jgi:hypothetical protein
VECEYSSERRCHLPNAGQEQLRCCGCTSLSAHAADSMKMANGPLSHGPLADAGRSARGTVRLRSCRRCCARAMSETTAAGERSGRYDCRRREERGRALRERGTLARRAQPAAPPRIGRVRPLVRVQCGFGLERLANGFSKRAKGIGSGLWAWRSGRCDAQIAKSSHDTAGLISGLGGVSTHVARNETVAGSSNLQPPAEPRRQGWANFAPRGGAKLDIASPPP